MILNSEIKSLLYFSIVFFLFLVVFPTLLTAKVPFFPLVEVSDLIDIFTPFLMMATYWNLYRLIPRVGEISLKRCWPLLVCFVLWVEGHGMHLSSNSIGNFVTEHSGNLFRLVDFYDEHLSHYLWLGGIVGVWFMLFFPFPKGKKDVLYPERNRCDRCVLIGSAFLYGMSYFMVVIEGQTSLLGVPAALFFVGISILRKKRNSISSAIIDFTLIAHLFASVLFLTWALYWRGLPEFSAVGFYPT